MQLASVGGPDGPNQRKEYASQFLIGQLYRLHIPIKGPVLHVLHSVPGRYLSQWPERFDFQKVIVGEGFERAPEIRIGLRRVRLGLLYECLTVQEVGIPGVWVEQSQLLRFAGARVLAKNHVLLG